jgi:nitroimidazol reductase NimA-like FMN-containing flavoprotein (pyridoxamine 5'-phosphate oxidase superfamily)
MIRVLATEEVERVLQVGTVGRIGCYAGGRTYVVPVSYVYHEGAIYAHSAYGQKIAMMRETPNVCFQVDCIEDLVNWTSAICWGTYEELQGEAANAGLELLREHLRSALPRVLEHGRLAAEEADGGETPVVFRINLAEMSGREERLHWELLPLATKEPQHNVESSFPSTTAEEWLSHERARQLAEAVGVLDVEDIWAAADKLAQGTPVAEITASSTYQGVDQAMAERAATFLAELRDSRATQPKPTAALIHATGLSAWSDMIPDDVLAERDAEDRGMVSLPAEADMWR